MKNYLLVIFLAATLNSFSQNAGNQGWVRYLVTYAPKGFPPDKYPGELRFKDQESLFSYDKKVVSAGRRIDTITPGGEKGIIFTPTTKVADTIGNVVFTNLLNNTQISREKIRNKSFIVEDTIVAPQWTIGAKTKKIGSFLCQNATARYYGRDYEAWFAPDIPAPFGPWKLNQLPGLILEAISSDGEVSFVAENIQINAPLELALQPPSSGEKVQGYLRFRDKQDQNSENTKKYAKSIIQEMQKPGMKVTLNGITVTPVRFELSLD